MIEPKHPKQPYTHNQNKVCKIEGCNELGYPVKCSTCGQIKLKTLCEMHYGQKKEMNRLFRGKLSTGKYYRTK